MQRRAVGVSACRAVPAALLMLSVLAAGEGASFAQDADVVVIEATEIASLQARRVPDVLNHVPGISASSSSVSIQGSYKVKVFVDGRPINDPSSSFSAVEWDLVNPEDIATIEIHRGKGAVKYGQDATGGVILITTRKTRSLTGNGKLYGGNQDTWNGTMTLQSVRGRITTGVNGAYETSEGYTINNDRRRWRAGGRAGYDISDKTSVLAVTDYVSDRRGLTGYPDFPTPFSRRESDLSNSSFQLRSRTFVSNTSFVIGSNRNTDVSLALDRTLTVSELSENVNTEHRFQRWGITTYGAGFLTSTASGTTFDDKREYTSSVFAVHALPKGTLPFSLSFGVRANVNSAFDDAINPEVKASYTHGPWTTTGSYSRSNNTPSFQQRYNETSTTRPNPDLQMETSQNLSGGVAVTWTPQVSAEVGIFYNQLQNRITYVLGDQGVGTYFNVGRATYAGGDASLTWKPVRPVSIRGSYSFLDATDASTGNWLPGKSRHTGTVLLQYRPRDVISLSLTERVQSSSYRDTRNTIVLAGYWLTELKVEYGARRATIFSEITNLFDHQYLYSDGLVAPPRTWYVGIGYKL